MVSAMVLKLKIKETYIQFCKQHDGLGAKNTWYICHEKYRQFCEQWACWHLACNHLSLAVRSTVHSANNECDNLLSGNTSCISHKAYEQMCELRTWWLFRWKKRLLVGTDIYKQICEHWTVDCWLETHHTKITICNRATHKCQVYPWQISQFQLLSTRSS